MQINIPEVLGELTAQFNEYERALLANEPDVLIGLFWVDPRSVRYGVAENLYGAEEIAAYRKARAEQGGGPQRKTTRAVITTYGRDFAYAIDVQVPGMLYGAVLRAPVEGAAPDKIDESKAAAVAGMVKVIRMPYGVGVVAETPWAAFQARETLSHSTTWTKSGKAWGFDSEKGLEDFAAAARDPKAEAAEWSKSGDPRHALSTAATTFEAE